MEIRDYQTTNSISLSKMLRDKLICAFVGEMRIGKTVTALETARLLNCKKVLFVTKKKAIKSIEDDFNMMNLDYEIVIINYESLHKVDTDGIDMLIADESHGFSSFPKPSKRAKDLKKVLVKSPKAYVLLLSGTFSPESYSQVYHQFWISTHTPFHEYTSFYKWSHYYVNIKKKRIGHFFVNDYSHALEEKIDEALEGYILSFTQEQAGFKSKVNEEIHTVDSNKSTLKLIQQLKKDKIIEGNDDVVIADTGAKMQQKIHQMFSGTIKLDSGKRLVLNCDKAEYIAKHFKKKRLAIIYKFVAESKAIKSVFGDEITNDLEKFQTNDTLHFMGQVTSTKEGTNLSRADVLVMYNIDFSATSYFQARARLSTIERPETQVHWIFTEGGIEFDIYKAVSKKKDYTLSYFKKYLVSL